MSVGAGAMMAGSVLANKMGADAQSSARNGVLNAANAAQQGFQQQATDKFNATLPLASRENADKNAGAAADVRAANDQALLGSIGAPAPAANASGPKDVGSVYSSAFRDSTKRGTIQSIANSKVGGVADANQKLGIDLTRAGEWQKIFADNMAHSAALVPGELNNANYAGGTERGIGGILGAGGQALGTAGLMGQGPTWGGLFGSGEATSIASPAASMGQQFGAKASPGGFFANLFTGG